jgi:hypothetical protein
LYAGNPVPWADFDGRLEQGAKAFEVRRTLTKEALANLISDYKKNTTEQADEVHLYGVNVSRDRGNRLDTEIESIVKDA